MSLARLAEAMMKTHELAFANRPDMAPFCSQGNAFKNVRLMDATYLSKQQSLSTLGRLGGILTIIGMMPRILNHKDSTRPSMMLMILTLTLSHLGLEEECVQTSYLV